MKRYSLLAASIVLALGSSSAFAYDASKVPEKKQTTLGLYMSAVEAHNAQIKGGKTLLIDVRSPEELAYVGVAESVDANIPFKFNVEPSPQSYDKEKGSFLMADNGDFVAMVTKFAASKGISKSDEIILMCRSGDRSANAVNALAKAGFTKVYSVYEGFEGDMSKEKRREVNGWKNEGLPWSYKISAGQAEPLVNKANYR